MKSFIKITLNIFIFGSVEPKRLARLSAPKRPKVLHFLHLTMTTRTYSKADFTGVLNRILPDALSKYIQLSEIKGVLTGH